ncbi:hypothetical protein [Richelia sinica]|uniref:hypothetical protein n=1 Tax=Richelia sinica TaxID=1357545 RepID=UPI0016863399|nr:hypothetical protein [Richelia sinica]MBD2667408.1 hypothetical protein [Richelia sinica FACHB-800]
MRLLSPVTLAAFLGITTFVFIPKEYQATTTTNNLLAQTNPANPRPTPTPTISPIPTPTPTSHLPPPNCHRGKLRRENI